MGEHTQRIRHPSELGTLTVWRLVPWHAPGRVLLDTNTTLPGKASWEAELTRLQAACGCNQGAVGLFLGAGTYLLYLLLRPGGWGTPRWPEFWAASALVLVTTSIGKFLGLLWAQHKLRRIIRLIRTTWEPVPPPGQSPAQTALREAHRRVLSTRCCGG